MRRVLPGTLLLVALAVAGALAQTNAVPSSTPAATQQPSSPQTAPGYTLDVRSNLVIEDVSVTDKQGNPVPHLPRTAFHLLDDSKPQTIASFDEGESVHASPAASAKSLTGEFTNAGLYSGSGPVVAMLLDPVSMSLPDQMFLRLQMLHYLQTMPAGTQAALFKTNSRGIPVLLQPLTTDRQQLIAAVNQGIPSIPRPAAAFDNAVAEIGNISDYLQQVPGKKVLLWFAGQFPLFLDPSLCSTFTRVDTVGAYTDCGSLNDEIKQAYRRMQEARIAVYPIDVRGVVELGPPAMPSMYGAKQPLTNSGPVSPPDLSPGDRVQGQYSLEDQVANATGGHAFYSNNGLAWAMGTAISLGESSYTLGYRPDPQHADDRWHKVRITVEGPYTLRYRTGYFDQEAAAPARPRLTASGDVLKPSVPLAGTLEASPAAPAAGESPIVFSAHVKPDGKDGKETKLRISYAIPSKELQFQAGDSGTAHARFRIVVFAYNTEGDLEGHAVDTIETRFTPEQMAIANRIGTPAEQTVTLGKGSQFLLLAVQDLASQRVGTVQLPLRDVAP